MTQPLITILPLLVAEIVVFIAINPIVPLVVSPVPHDVPLKVRVPELLVTVAADVKMP